MEEPLNDEFREENTDGAGVKLLRVLADNTVPQFDPIIARFIR